MPAWRTFSVAALTACVVFAFACADKAQRSASKSTAYAPQPVGQAEAYLPTDTVIDHRGLNVRDLHADTLLAHVDLEHVSDLAVVGQYLWASHYYHAPFFHIIDTASGRLVASLGRAGQGPGEFEGVSSLILAREGDTTVLAWDSGLNRFSRVSLSLLQNPNSGSIPIIETKEHAAWITARGKDGFVSYHAFGDHFFTLFSANGEVVGKEDVPLPGAESISRHERQESLNGATVCSMRDGSGFALTYPSAGRIQMYDSLAKPTVAVKVPYPDREVFERSEREKQMVLRTRRRYYLGCAFSRDRLYALFSGKVTPVGATGAWDDGARFIHVFDLNGELVDVLRLSNTIHSITVDGQGTRAFATSFRKSVAYRINLQPGRE